MEFQGLRGDLILSGPGADGAHTEACFGQAIEAAHGRGVTSFELPRRGRLRPAFARGGGRQFVIIEISKILLDREY